MSDSILFYKCGKGRNERAFVRRKVAMSDTTATVHAEILEAKKQELDAQIEILRGMKNRLNDDGGFEYRVELIDAEIDSLLVEKDNLCLDVPNGWTDDGNELCAALSEDFVRWKAEVNARAFDEADLKATQDAASRTV